jgi:hypothetical protein
MIHRTVVRLLNFLFCRKEKPRIIAPHHSATSSLNTSTFDADKSKTIVDFDLERRGDKPVAAEKAKETGIGRANLRVIVFAGRKVSICKKIRDLRDHSAWKIRKSSHMGDKIIEIRPSSQPVSRLSVGEKALIPYINSA